MQFAHSGKPVSPTGLPPWHVRRKRGHFCVGKPVDQSKNAFLADFAARGIVPQAKSGGGGKAANPKGLPVRPVGRTAEGSNQRFEARHRLAGETGLPLITVRPGMNGETRYQPGMTYPHFPYRHFFAQLI